MDRANVLESGIVNSVIQPKKTLTVTAAYNHANIFHLQKIESCQQSVWSSVITIINQQKATAYQTMLIA